MHPRLSIIIPCYNLGKYLKRCLESISIQPIGKVEYIFVNDGSTDNTFEELSNFCQNRPFCKLIDQKNAGVSAARNVALNICDGEYIYLLDGDDVLVENSISLMLDSVSDYSIDLVIPGSADEEYGKTSVFQNPLREGIYTSQELFNSCKIFPTGVKLIYKKSIISDNNLYFDEDLHSGEVYEFTIRFLNFARKVKVISSFFCYNILRPTSASHHPNIYKDLSVITTIRKYCEYGRLFRPYSSFWTTSFKMVMTFTYNKYVKLKLSDQDTLDTINKILSNPIINECMRKVSSYRDVPIRERILAIYALSTKIWGYKILTLTLKIYEKINHYWGRWYGPDHI